MKTKTQKVLPKTADEIANGGVYVQRVRCGKSNCKCARGEHHTALYYFTRRRGKLVKLYIRKAEAEDFSAMVEQATVERRRRRQTSKVSAELLSKFRTDSWENDGLIKALRDNQDYE